jgi:hypothetical protein
MQAKIVMKLTAGIEEPTDATTLILSVFFLLRMNE